jgi:transcriptional regulator with XRE-family HTH domain
MSLGEKLKYIRKRMGFTQKIVCDNVGIKVTSYSQYENNSRQPDYNILLSLSNFYKVSVDFLINTKYDTSDMDLYFDLQQYSYNIVQVAKIFVRIDHVVSGKSSISGELEFLISKLDHYRNQIEGLEEAISEKINIKNLLDEIEAYMEYGNVPSSF